MNDSEFHEWVTSWVQLQDTWRSSKDDNPFFWAAEKFYSLMSDNPDLCWRAILKILELSPNDTVISNLAAGPLEDLIHYHGESFINKIEEEARKNPSFRKLLGGVWETGNRDIWCRVEAIRGKPW